MPGVMTRAEAICVCNNIIDLEEELSEILPSGYSPGDTARGIRNTLRQSTRKTHASEKQDGALRRMWEGLRKWDRKDEHNDDMFWGLADVIEELSSENADDGADDTSSGSSAPVKGIESDGDDELTPEQKAFLDQKRQQAVADQQARRERKQPAPAAASNAASAASSAIVDQSRLIEALVKAREEAISVVLNQAHGKHLSVVKIDDIRHGQIENVLNKTSSDRTQQLIFAAFYAGKVAGANLCHEESRKAVTK